MSTVELGQPTAGAMRAAKLNEIRQRMRDSKKHLVNWWDSDVEFLLSELNDRETGVAELVAALKDLAATLEALSAKHRDGMDNLVGTTLFNARAVLARQVKGEGSE